MSTIRQAGAIAVRRRGEVAELLVVRAKKNPQDWIFPKGHIEPGEDANAAAVRELREEGGIVGHAADLIGTSRFVVNARHVEVAYYLVWYVADAEPAEDRERLWLTFEGARAALTYDDARQYVDRVADILSGGIP